MTRVKLTVQGQIENMKSHGIHFNIIDEDKASAILKEKTYYFKLKAYAKNYETYLHGEKAGQYINLEFAYLSELSKIDTLIRRNILWMCIDLEHYLKARMLYDLSESKSDGYDIVHKAFARFADLKSNIIKKGSASCCSALVEKYKDEWAIWNMVEVLDFRSFIEVYKMFYQEFTDKRDSYTFYPCMFPIRMLRNAAAHNNCLIHRLRPPHDRSAKTPNLVSNELGLITSISPKTKNSRMEIPFVSDFVTLLYTYYHVVPEDSRKKGFAHLAELFNNRILENEAYFTGNEVITSTFHFLIDLFTFYG